jgi:hypothetical protein
MPNDEPSCVRLLHVPPASVPASFVLPEEDPEEDPDEEVDVPPELDPPDDDVSPDDDPVPELLAVSPASSAAGSVMLLFDDPLQAIITIAETDTESTTTRKRIARAVARGRGQCPRSPSEGLQNLRAPA